MLLVPWVLAGDGRQSRVLLRRLLHPLPLSLPLSVASVSPAVDVKTTSSRAGFGAHMSQGQVDAFPPTTWTEGRHVTSTIGYQELNLGPSH